MIIRTTQFEPYFDPVNDYSRMLSELTADDTRNRLIASDVSEAVHSGSGVCLVLSDRKKHCEVLQGLLRYKHGVVSELLTGDLNAEARKKVLPGPLHLVHGHADPIQRTVDAVSRSDPETITRQNLCPGI